MGRYLRRFTAQSNLCIRLRHISSSLLASDYFFYLDCVLVDVVAWMDLLLTNEFELWDVE